MNESEAALLRWLRKRSSGSVSGKVRASGLIPMAAAALNMDLLEVRGGLRELRKAALISYAPDTNGLPYSGFLSVTSELIEEPQASKAWRTALQMSGVDAELFDALAPSYDVFADLDETDMALAACGLLRVRAAAKASTEFGFSVSAREVLASSKVLDRLSSHARRLLGVDGLASTPRYVVVAGPSKPIAVLLIENSTTFELAVRVGLDDDLVLIAAYGYGLNMLSDSTAGWALVDSITSGRCEVLSRTGRDHRMEELFQHERLYFWGDLDREGLRIAMALRRKLPQLKLSGLYAPMYCMVQHRHTSHPYANLSAKAAQLPWVVTGNEQLDQLAASCATRAVDQEAVDIGLHGHLARQDLGDLLSRRN